VWYHNDEVLHKPSKSVYRTRYNDLTIRKAKKRDAGLYKCRGKTESHLIFYAETMLHIAGISLSAQ